MEPSVSAHRIKVYVPQRISDQHTLAAQAMAGFLVGHPYRHYQQSATILVDESKAWREPVVLRDKCLFCERMTDESVKQRIMGYQAAIDKESISPVGSMYQEWLTECGPTVIDVNEMDTPDGKVRRGNQMSMRNRRAFLAENASWIAQQPFPMFELPMRLQRKLCIQWNHIYTDWMAESPEKEIQYDWEQHEFFRMTTDPITLDQEVDESFVTGDGYGYAIAMAMAHHHGGF